MKTRNATPLLAVALSAGFCLPSARAAIAPYTTADAHTTYLFHFDEAAGTSTAANSVTGGRALLSVKGNPYAGDGVEQPIITSVLGAGGLSGFGLAANVTADACLGLDANGDGMFKPGDAAPVGDDQMPDHTTFFGPGNAFTLEAMINVGSITTGNREIICTDHNGAAADRGFQFRINATGNLEFNFIGTTPAAFIAPIPTTGLHAFSPNEWFHVAVTYDGTVMTFYWTKVDPSQSVANSIGTNFSETVDVNDDAILVIGNEGRSTGGLGGEPLNGLIDEVRISRIARSASEFIFSASTTDSDGDGLSDDWEVRFFRESETETIAQILAKQTGTGDPDGDGANNLAEQQAGSDPNDRNSVPGDIDGDSLPDAWEILHFGSTSAQDTFGDPDGDFVPNLDEFTAGTDPSGEDGYLSFPDTENGTGDGLNDAWEFFYFGNLSQTAAGDPDGDLYTNAEEYLLKTDPMLILSSPDSDGDKLNDGWEAQHFHVAGESRATTLARQSGTDDADGDGYTNDEEESAGTSPVTQEKPSDLDADGLIDSWEFRYFGSLDPNPSDNTDGDAFNNAAELAAGSDPTSAASVPGDTNGDGIPDGNSVLKPYTVDSHTLHLWHLDEIDQPAANAVSGGPRLGAVNAAGQMWAASLPGFGTGFRASENRGSPSGGVLSGKPLAADDSDDVTLTYTGETGAFTFEAIARLDFDPWVAPASTAAMQIITGENDHASPTKRVWQFRISPIGGPGNLAGTAPLLEFINLHGDVGIQSLTAPLPSGTDPDAAVEGGWYHIAVTYNGNEGTPGNFKFYWTKLDPARTAARELFSGQMTNDLILSTPDLTVGNEGRDTGGSPDSFLGVLDEVRISSIARSPGGFLFHGAGDNDNLDDSWELLHFGNLDQGDTDDFDGDGTDNLTEFRLGLIPTSGASRFFATRDATGAIRWPSATGVTFRIERSTSLTSWTVLNPSFPGTAGTATYTDSAPPSGRAFYRVTLLP